MSFILNFYKILIVSELQNSFCPLPNSKLFLNVKKNKEEIEKIIERMNSFNTHYSEMKNKNVANNPGSVAGSAILAGIDSLKNIGGRVIVLSCNSCKFGYGSCSTREDTKFYETEFEKTLYHPQNDKFLKLSDQIVTGKMKIAVDLFIFGNAQLDLATFSPICNNTGGQIFYYEIDFTIPDDLKHKYDLLHYNLSRLLTRPSFYDVNFMLRHSHGFEPIEILGSFNKKSGSGFSLASCDPDLSFSYIFRINESLQDTGKYHFQLVTLFIDNFGKQYLRTINYCLTATKDISK